ncbi:MAG: thioredoxin family protein [Microthrixaceae bacterium]|nr:TM0996/MTH895 family glutaredoxin-like protein [Microthrixaceae bacterium]MCO5322801.1 thioredoxin family protein [Microthrixaceae bacterium]
MNIKILGTGCSKCEQLEVAARAAVADAGVEAEFDKITDPAEIAAWGVMATPALVIDDEVATSGRVPSEGDIRQLLADR